LPSKLPRKTPRGCTGQGSPLFELSQVASDAQAPEIFGLDDNEDDVEDVDPYEEVMGEGAETRLESQSEAFIKDISLVAR
jgi:hypothetical protein